LVSSFENGKKNFFPSFTFSSFGPNPSQPSTVFPFRGPARLIQPRGPASIRQPTGGPVADPRLLLLVPLAGGSQWSSLTFGRTRAAPGRTEPAPPWLCAGRVLAPPPFLGPARPGSPLGLFSRRRRASLGFCPPYPQQPRAAAIQTLGRRRPSIFPRPLPLRRRGVGLELRTVVRKPQVPHWVPSSSTSLGRHRRNFCRRRYPPLRDSCRRRRASVHACAAVRIEALRASPRCIPRRKPCLGAPFRATPAILPPRAAVSGEPAAGRPLVDAPDRPPRDLWSRSHLAPGQTGVPVNTAMRQFCFCKRNPDFLLFYV
jgi:hypothetical protein